MGCQGSKTSMASEPQAHELFANTLLQVPSEATVAKLEEPSLKVVHLVDASEVPMLKVVQLDDATEELDAASVACDGPKSDIRTRVPTGFAFEADVPKEGRPRVQFKEEHEELDAASSSTDGPKNDLRTRVSTGFAFEQNGPGLVFKEQSEELDAASNATDGPKRDVRTRVLTGFAFEQNSANAETSGDDAMLNAEDMAEHEAVELQCCLFGEIKADCAMAPGLEEDQVVSSHSEESLRTCCPTCACDYAPLAKNCRRCGQARPWMPWARNDLKAKWPPAPQAGNAA